MKININKTRYHMIRPGAVIRAQLKLLVRGLWFPTVMRTGRVITHSEVNMLGPFVTSVHYIQISTEDGEIHYRTPHMTSKDRVECVRRINAVRDFSSLKRGSYDY